jgi:TonB-dependent SusC/RagA subfamily outer membrane receptor
MKLKLNGFLVLLLALVTQITFAQERAVSGTVSDNTGLPLPGVSVLVKGTKTGTQTDFDGKYSIKATSSQTLVFSYIGMQTQEVKATSTNVNVKLASEAIMLEGAVVTTALGISKKTKSLGYSVQDVKGDAINKAKEVNIINSLQGRVSGAQITNTSGAVGASSRIVIRGVSSLGGNNQPLFVIDGIPISNSSFGSTGNEGTDRGSGANDINPDDVETITVLKGANASALYGSRASNGVIVITTKKGAKGSKLQVSLNQTNSYESPLKLPDFQNKYGQGNSGKFAYVDGAGGGINDGSDESWGPKLDAGLLIPQFSSPVDANGNIIPTPWISHPDNVKNVFETGTTQSTTLDFLLQILIKKEWFLILISKRKHFHLVQVLVQQKK